MAKAKTKPVSTQEHLRIAEIRDGVLILTSGELRQVLLVSSVNFALKSEDEQNAIIFQFQNFLNSLTFPIQIVMQSRRLDLAPYLGKLQERLDSEQNELIRMQITDYMEFIKRLLSVANIMDKNFFVIVPHSPPVTKKGNVFSQLLGGSKRLQPHFTAEQFTQYKRELGQRVNVTVSGLSSGGLRAAVLSTQQLVELFYATYNPEEATKERLTYTQLLSAPVVGQDGEAERLEAATTPVDPAQAVAPPVESAPASTPPAANPAQAPAASPIDDLYRPAALRGQQTAVSKEQAVTQAAPPSNPQAGQK